MVVSILIIIALILDLADKKHLFKKPITYKKRITIGLMVIAAIASWYQQWSSDNQAQLDSVTISRIKKQSDSLQGIVNYTSKQVVDFRKETKTAQKALLDSTSAYHTDNSDKIKNVAYRMAKIFAENKEEHKTTQSKIDKIDTNGKILPAFVALANEPHNRFKINFENDTLSAEVIIENFGNAPAYLLSESTYFVFILNGIAYKQTSNAGMPQTLTGNTRRYITTNKIFINTNMCKLILEYYFILDCEYYADDEHKNKKSTRLICGLDKDMEPIGYSLSIPIEDLLKNAVEMPQ